MSARSIAVFGGSFNPPALHHVEIAKVLSQNFDEVLIIPCGNRPDKPSANELPSVHRAALVDLAFSGIDRVSIELFDLELKIFTRTIELEHRFQNRGKLWHVIGADLIQGGSTNSSPIQTQWVEGQKLWAESNFAVFTRPGIDIQPQDLPPNHRLFNLTLESSSTEIREKLFNHLPVTNYLPPAVMQYIDRHGLYSGGAVSGRNLISLTNPNIQLIIDNNNRKAVQMAKEFPISSGPKPDLFVVIGGDGTMLRAIRHHWRKRIPFYGINAGHTGFLLNSHSLSFEEITKRTIVLHHLPLLFVEVQTMDNKIIESLAFNDVWVERASGQSAWISISVNDKLRIEQLVADGALVATASGSAAYARAMGAAAIPFNTPVMLLVGSNVFKPYDWKFAVLPIESVVEFKALDPEKRPLIGYCDGENLGPVKSMKIKLSGSAAAELAFEPEFDPGEKLAQIQFPSI